MSHFKLESSPLCAAICILFASATLACDLSLAQAPAAPSSDSSEAKVIANSSSASASPIAENSKRDSPAPIVLVLNPTLPPINVNGSGVSPEKLKAARDAGFKIKVVAGKTHFCKTEAELGTRFVEEHCINEQMLEQWLDRSEQQRERLKAIKGSGTDVH